MIKRRNFIATAIAAAISASLMLAAAPAMAQGGNDPIPGIDIIIKKDPGSQPIKPFSLGAGQIKTLNHLKGADRPTFVLKSIAGRIDAGKGFVQSGMKVLGKIWCGPCKMADETSVKFRDGKVTYTLDLAFRGAERSDSIMNGTAPERAEGAVTFVAPEVVTIEEPR